MYTAQYTLPHPGKVESDGLAVDRSSHYTAEQSRGQSILSCPVLFCSVLALRGLACAIDRRYEVGGYACTVTHVSRACLTGRVARCV